MSAGKDGQDWLVRRRMGPRMTHIHISAWYEHDSGSPLSMQPSHAGPIKLQRLLLFEHWSQATLVLPPLRGAAADEVFAVA